MESHDFSIQRIYVRKRLAVVKVGQSLVSDDSIDFGLCFLLDVGVEHHHVDEGSERREGLKGNK
jgi:hypothetical protein